MKIDQGVALQVLREEARKVALGTINQQWLGKVRHLSDICERLGVMTHIAFLGTAILAKSVDRHADLFVIKPAHAVNNPNAFSARSLCHGVLVPFSAEEGFSLGVHGREPLNNQPYFRMRYLGDGTPIRPSLRPAFDYMLDLVKELAKLSTEAEAREALRAYIFVRKQYQKTYAVNEDPSNIGPSALLKGIALFVGEESEGGRRAQAVVAGLMDVYAGPDRVESGRINDPSRHYPGDVSIRDANGDVGWEKAIEVRDKPVSYSDAQVFGRLCAQKQVREAAIVMVGDNQLAIDQVALQKWADGLGIGLTLFKGWVHFIEQVLFWSSVPRHEAVNIAAKCIESRLIAVEASEASIGRWWKCLDSARVDD